MFKTVNHLIFYMKCMFCERTVEQEDAGNSLDKKAVSIGNKIICINCLHSLGILIKKFEIEAKVGRI